MCNSHIKKSFLVKCGMNGPHINPWINLCRHIILNHFCLKSKRWLFWGSISHSFFLTVVFNTSEPRRHYFHFFFFMMELLELPPSVIGFFLITIGAVFLFIWNILSETCQRAPEVTLESSRSSSPSRLSTMKLKEIPWSNELQLMLNGVRVVLVNPNPTELLVSYIRDKAGLKGTKLGCEEGGCGACTVVLTKEDGIVSVNSCLRPLCANDGLSITTIEGIGSIRAGLSEEQSSIVKNNGKTCFFFLKVINCSRNSVRLLYSRLDYQYACSEFVV